MKSLPNFCTSRLSSIADPATSHSQWAHRNAPVGSPARYTNAPQIITSRPGLGTHSQLLHRRGILMMSRKSAIELEGSAQMSRRHAAMMLEQALSNVSFGSSCWPQELNHCLRPGASSSDFCYWSENPPLQLISLAHLAQATKLLTRKRVVLNPPLWYAQLSMRPRCMHIRCPHPSLWEGSRCTSINKGENSTSSDLCSQAGNDQASY